MGFRGTMRGVLRPSSRFALVVVASLASLAAAACGAEESAGDAHSDAAVFPAKDASAVDGVADGAVSVNASVDAPASDTSIADAAGNVDAAPFDAAPLVDSAPVDAGAPYDESLFMATHNS